MEVVNKLKKKVKRTVEVVFFKKKYLFTNYMFLSHKIILSRVDKTIMIHKVFFKILNITLYSRFKIEN